MSAHILLNLLKVKEEHFFHEFNKFNNTGARMLYDIKITLKSHFWRKKDKIFSLCTQHYYGHHNILSKSINH